MTQWTEPFGETSSAANVNVKATATCTFTVGELGMRPLIALVGATTVTAAGMFSAAAPASASDYGFEINGTYSVLSNGEWAKTNEVFNQQAVVRSTWQVSSTCTSTASCEGQVTSDQGWTAPLRFRVDRWLVTRDIPGWAPCGDGTAATGRQMFLFYGIDDDGQNTRNTDLLGGREIIKTDSGSCGRNRGLVMEIPLRITRIS